MMNSLAGNLLAALVWAILVLLLVLVVALVRLFFLRRGWVRDHGPMLLVYFRNVDWRCGRIQEQVEDLLNARDDRQCAQSIWHVRRELLKLTADLGAFERLADMWARQLNLLPAWFFFSKSIRQLLDEHSELHVALMRHIDPLLLYMDELTNGMVHEFLRRDSRFRSDLEHYANYFRGGQDRLWIGGLRKGESVVPKEDDVLVKLRDELLHIRLKKLFKATTKLLKDGGVRTGGFRIWESSEDPSALWFRPRGAAAGQDASGGRKVLAERATL